MLTIQMVLHEEDTYPDVEKWIQIRNETNLGKLNKNDRQVETDKKKEKPERRIKTSV